MASEKILKNMYTYTWSDEHDNDCTTVQATNPARPSSKTMVSLVIYGVLVAVCSLSWRFGLEKHRANLGQKPG